MPLGIATEHLVALSIIIGCMVVGFFVGMYFTKCFYFNDGEDKEEVKTRKISIPEVSPIKINK